MREIRGWNIGEVVTAAYMKANTANLLEVIGSSGEPNLPCIYNGLSLASQSGTGGDTVTFNPGVARCQDLPLSVFTYLPPNPYGTSYPCFIDISTLDANKTIVLDPAITSGYIVATFAISPTTPDATNYVITGSLMQIATGSYDPTHQVRLCSFVYAISTFTLDFTPETSRDTDLTGLGSVQWDFQNSSLVIDTPASQSGTSIVLKQNTIIRGLLDADNITIKNGGQLEFLDPGETFAVTFKAPGGLTATTHYEWPYVPPDPNATPDYIPQALTADFAGNFYWTYMRDRRITFVQDSIIPTVGAAVMKFDTLHSQVNFFVSVPTTVYDPATGIFTAPIDQTYKIEIAIKPTGVSPGANLDVSIVDVVTSDVLASFSQSIPSGSGDTPSLNASVYINLIHGQTIKLISNSSFSYGGVSPNVGNQFSVSWYSGLS